MIVMTPIAALLFGFFQTDMLEQNELWYTIEKRCWAVIAGLGMTETDSKTGGTQGKVD